jgi:hypothetical protein
LRPLSVLLADDPQAVLTVEAGGENLTHQRKFALVQAYGERGDAQA